MKSLFIIGFFLSCQPLMAQTYTLTNKTATTRSVVTFNVDLKTGVAATVSATTSPYIGVRLDASPTPAPSDWSSDLSFSTYQEPATATSSSSYDSTSRSFSTSLYE